MGIKKEFSFIVFIILIVILLNVQVVFSAVSKSISIEEEPFKQTKVSAGNGCNIADPECGFNPVDGCDVRQNTTFNSTTHILNSGLDICANDIVLDCNGAKIVKLTSGGTSGISINSINGTTIKNCNISSSSQSESAIYLVSAYYNSIINNTGRDAYRGIFLSSSHNNTLINNTLYSGGGISLSASEYNTLIGNTMHDSDGIELADYSNYNLVFNNNASFNGRWGIEIFRSFYNNISNNTVNSNGVDGILLTEDSSGNFIADNEVSYNKGGVGSDGNRGDAIRLFGASNSNIILRNTINSNNGQGIGLYLKPFFPCNIAPKYNIISNNVVESNTLSGIALGECSHFNIITNNIANSNIYNGIFSYYSRPLISNNTANNNGQYGFYLIAYSQNFTNNIANSNNLSGIYMSPSNSNISNNIANMNNQTGIYIEGAGPQQNIIADNIANSNGQNGIYTYASGKNDIRNNIVNSNGQYGIFVYSYAEDNLTNNTANSNGFAGISLLGTNYNNLINNTANNNRAYGLLIDKSVGNIVNSSTFCSNSLLSGFYDLADLEGSGNLGFSNTCDTAFNWTENNNTCTYSCTYPQLIIITQYFPSNTLGIFSSHKLKAGGGNPPYNWSLINGTLPAGMVLNPDGIFNGTSSNAGNFIFTVRVTDNTNQVAEKTFTKLIYVTLPPVKLSINKWGTTAVPGRILDYFIVVKNIDNLPVENVTVFELLEPSLFNLTFTNPKASIGEEDQESSIKGIYWDFPTIIPLETHILNYKIKLNGSTPIGAEIIGGPACNVIESICPKDPGEPQAPFNKPLSDLEVRSRRGASGDPLGGFHCIRIQNGTPKFHNGIDLLAQEGTPVYPVKPGIVSEIVSNCQLGDKDGDKECGGGFGNHVKIIHLDDEITCESLYAHLNITNVHENDFVSLTTVIGHVGRTGNAIGIPENETHLHFEYICEEKPVDPCAGLGNPENCSCKRCKMPECTEHKQNTTRPVDPNEKGVLNSKFINSNETLTYTIHFENIENVSARDVFLTDVLDNNLNTSTVMIFNLNGSFIPLNIGETLTLLVQNKTINYTIGNFTFNETFLEHWSVSLNGRTLFWNLTGIELPINETNGVLFNIKPIQGLQSGTEIKNNATIQFEIFENITTNSTLNIIDEIAPSCVMNSLPEYSFSPLNFSWSGSDTVGEIDSYTIFSSNIDTGFSQIITNTKDTTLNIILEGGKTHEFICIAKDTASNVEIQNPIAESSTTILLCGDTTGNGAITAADIIYLVNYVFRGGPTPIPIKEVADVNNDGIITSADIIYLVNYVFRSGSEPFCPSVSETTISTSQGEYTYEEVIDYINEAQLS